MHAIQSNATIQDESRLSGKALEQRLGRETAARIEAERLLEAKSRELFASNSALERLAQNLDSHRQQLNTILDHTLAGIFLVNDRLDVIQVNKAGRDLFGLADDDDVLELSIVSIFDDPKLIKEKVADLRNPECSVDEIHAEADGIRFDNQIIPVEVSVSAVKIKDRSATVWIFRDITERRAEEQRRKAIEAELSQAQKLEALGTLASGVAHEINTPIQYIGDNVRFAKDSFNDLFKCVRLYQSAVKALSEAGIEPDLVSNIKSAEDDVDVDFLLDEITPALEQSAEGLDQVAHIVRAIKEFSHPGDAEISDIDVNDAIKTTATMSRNRWKYAADLTLDLDLDLPKVGCAAGDINQILLNLIGNAADAISDARTEDSVGKIIVKSQRHDVDHFSITVTDNGCGIDEQTCKRIFDPFFTTKDIGKGTGQGLAITYNLITQKYQGTIACESVKGHGTSFKIVLPIDHKQPDLIKETIA